MELSEVWVTTDGSKVSTSKGSNVLCRAPGRSGRAAAQSLSNEDEGKAEEGVTTQGRLQLKSKAEFGVRRLKDKTETGPGS